VLVVDDDPICRIAAKGLLERLGLSVDTAADGREAQELAARWAYTAVFMDCYMPEIDGYEATREIRAQMEPEHAPPVIALTSHPRHVCLSAGLDYHIPKPLRIESLRDDCTSLGLLPWTGAVAAEAGAPIRDGSPEQLPLLSGDAGAGAGAGAGEDPDLRPASDPAAAPAVAIRESSRPGIPFGHRRRAPAGRHGRRRGAGRLAV
jgi:CheY-like chemotaxis protein